MEVKPQILSGFFSSFLSQQLANFLARHEKKKTFCLGNFSSPDFEWREIKCMNRLRSTKEDENRFFLRQKHDYLRMATAEKSKQQLLLFKR